MNCRFKSIFTPYADKKIGEFYEPITLKAASKKGISYKFPRWKLKKLEDIYFADRLWGKEPLNMFRI